MRVLLGMVVVLGGCSSVPVTRDEQLPPSAVEHMQKGALLYSWAGACRWGAITTGLLTVVAVGSTSDSSKDAIAPLAITTAVQLGCALLLDNAADNHYEEAAGIADYQLRPVTKKKAKGPPPEAEDEGAEEE